MSDIDLLETIQGRTSIKKYTREGIDREDLGRILEAGRWAPSAGNMQSMELVVVEDQDLKDKLSQYAYNQEHLREAPVNIVILGDTDKARRRFDDRGVDMYMIQETAAAMQNMLLMAEEIGLGAAWVGAFDEEQVQDLLDIPPKLRPVAIITLGHPRERPEPANKYRVTDFTYINRYGNRLHAIYDKIVWKGAREYARRAINSIKNSFRKQ